MNIVFCTLGPEGTCHDNALKNYIKFQKLDNASIVYISKFSDAVDLLRRRPQNQLIRFEKIFLSPNEEKTVEFNIKVEELSDYDENMQYVCEPREIEFKIEKFVGIITITKAK